MNLATGTLGIYLAAACIPKLTPTGTVHTRYRLMHVPEIVFCYIFFPFFF